MATELIGTLDGEGIHSLAVTVDRDGTVTVWASAPVRLADGEKLADLALKAREASSARRSPVAGKRQAETVEALTFGQFQEAGREARGGE